VRWSEGARPDPTPRPSGPRAAASPRRSVQDPRPRLPARGLPGLRKELGRVQRDLSSSRAPNNSWPVSLCVLLWSGSGPSFRRSRRDHLAHNRPGLFDSADSTSEKVTGTESLGDRTGRRDTGAQRNGKRRRNTRAPSDCVTCSPSMTVTTLRGSPVSSV
jgi:hypothetical protein